MDKLSFRFTPPGNFWLVLSGVKPTEVQASSRITATCSSLLYVDYGVLERNSQSHYLVFWDRHHYPTRWVILGSQPLFAQLSRDHALAQLIPRVSSP